MDLSLKCPFVAQVCGPTQSGKSEFVGKLIREHLTLFEQPISYVDWYSPHGILPNSLKKYKKIPINVKRSLPWEKTNNKQKINDDDDDDDWLSDNEEVEENKLPHFLIVIDDFMNESTNSNELTEYMTRGSHHKNFSFIQLTQNIFWRSKDARTRTLNLHYVVLMKQYRDIQQIRLLSRQIAHGPGDSTAFMGGYKDATSQRPYSYLLISFHPRDDRALMLRTNIFDGEEPQDMIYTLPSEKHTYRTMINERKGIKEKEEDD